VRVDVPERRRIEKQTHFPHDENKSSIFVSSPSILFH